MWESIFSIVIFGIFVILGDAVIYFVFPDLFNLWACIIGGIVGMLLLLYRDIYKVIKNG